MNDSNRNGLLPQKDQRAKRLLIVEEDRLLCEKQAAWFQGLGFAVSVANTQDEACQLAQSELPELVVTRVRMPGLTVTISGSPEGPGHPEWLFEMLAARGYRLSNERNGEWSADIYVAPAISRFSTRVPGLLGSCRQVIESPGGDPGQTQQGGDNGKEGF